MDKNCIKKYLFGSNRGAAVPLTAAFLLLLLVGVAFYWIGSAGTGGGRTAAVAPLATTSSSAASSGGPTLTLYGGGGKVLFSGGATSAQPYSGPCSTTTAPQVTFTCYDKLNGNTVSGSVNYQINRGSTQTVACGTAITNLKAVPTPDVIDAIIGGAGGANAEYNISVHYITECAQAVTIPVGLVRMSTAPTITITNDDGTTLNSGSAGQAIGANDVRNVEYKLRAEGRRGLQGVLQIVEYNTSEFLAPLSNKPVVPVPGFYTTNRSGASRAMGFYISDNLEGSSGAPSQEEVWYISHRTTSVNPTVTDVDSCFKDGSWYIDELDDRKFKYGQDDENQVAQGQTCAAGRQRKTFFS